MDKKNNQSIILQMLGGMFKKRQNEFPKERIPVLPKQETGTVTVPWTELGKDSEFERRMLWDCIWFGKYPMEEVDLKEEIFSKLERETQWDSKGDLSLESGSFRRIIDSNAYYLGQESYKYYRFTPIKWRVIEVKNQKATLISDMVLEKNKKNWEESNKKFLEVAFSDKEKEVLFPSVFQQEDYGFYGTDSLRRAKATAYAKASGVFSNVEGYSLWCLRTIAEQGEKPYFVSRDGGVDNFGDYVNNNSVGVRIAISLDLQDQSLWQYAGTVSSDGEIDEIPFKPEERTIEPEELEIKPEELEIEPEELEIEPEELEIEPEEIETEPEEELAIEPEELETEPEEELGIEPEELEAEPEEELAIEPEEELGIEPEEFEIEPEEEQETEPEEELAIEPEELEIEPEEELTIEPEELETEPEEELGIEPEELEAEPEVNIVKPPVVPSVEVEQVWDKPWKTEIIEKPFYAMDELDELYGGTQMEKSSQVITASISPAVIVYGKTAVFTGSGIGSISFTSNDPEIAEVNAQGIVIAKKAGDAYITMNAQGNENYNEASATLKVSVAPRSISNAVIDVAKDGNVYNGEEIKPEVQVQLDGIDLVEERDFVVSYIDNINAGEASVKVTGVGNYAGSKTKSFVIAKATQTVEASVASVEVIANESTNVIAEGQGEIHYSSNDEDVVTVDSVGIVTANNVGTAKITVTAAGNRNYEAASTSVMIRVVPIDLSNVEIQFFDEKNVYDGTEKQPEITVLLGGNILLKEINYKLAYADNVNAGVGTVIVSGIGNYTGAARGYFNIEKAVQNMTASIDLSNITVGETAKIKATGEGILSYSSNDANVVSVSENGLVTAENVGATSIVVTASGNENYEQGTVVVEVETEPIDASNAMITMIGSEYAYTGSEIIPDLMIQHEGNTLTNGVDYELNFENNVNAGTATVIMNGIGNYIGYATRTFTIDRARQFLHAEISNSDLAVGEESNILIQAQGTIIYSSSSRRIASVDGTGKVVAQTPGTAVITIIATGNENYREASATVSVNVREG